METEIRTYFDDIVQQAAAFFDDLDHQIDISPERAILRINATYKQYRIFATELKSPEYRKYNYYVLEVDFVVAGFDNSPDVRAVRMKYSKLPESNADRLVPHAHFENKTVLKLTEELYFSDFIEWMQDNLEGDDASN